MDPHESTTENRTQQRPTKRRSWLIFGILVIAAVAASAYVLTRLNSDDPKASKRTTVASFQGTGDETTDEFRVTKPWRVDWKNSGKRFSFAITGDRDLGTIVERKDPGTGITNVDRTGTYKLVIKAKGAWSVSVLQDE